MSTGGRSARGICGSLSHTAEHFRHMFGSWTLRLGRCVIVLLIDKLSVVFEALRLWTVLDRISNALNGTFCLACNVPDGLSRLIGGALSGIRCLFDSACDSFSCSGRSLLRLFYWVEAFIEEAHRPCLSPFAIKGHYPTDGFGLYQCFNHRSLSARKASSVYSIMDTRFSCQLSMLQRRRRMSCSSGTTCPRGRR